VVKKKLIMTLKQKIFMSLQDEGPLERGSKLIEFKSRISKMNNRQLKQYVEILKTELIKRKNK
tara:strand:- start:936 stop:1124 length:189 start_codon:yes stop_codon:yes gene_type:complete